MFNDILRIKWAGGGISYIELNSNDERLYCTKKELVAIMLGIQEFINQYPEDFYGEAIEYVEDFSDFDPNPTWGQDDKGE